MENDYYPFGMNMPGRKYQAGSASYRYSINGQEKESDINENITTALYWEYDSRIGRRWNVDPRPVTGVSPYVCFLDNPIWMSDPKGDTTGRPETEQGNWYRSQEGNLIRYKFIQNVNKDEIKSSDWLIPESSRERVIQGKNGETTITLNPNGTFLVQSETVGVVPGSREWTMKLSNDGYLYVKGAYAMFNRAVGDGAFWEAALWLSGEKITSLAFKGGGKILTSYMAKQAVKNAATDLAIKEGENVVYHVVENGVTKYVGITNNFTRRAAEHLAQRGLVIRPLLTNLTRKEARCVEQALIIIHGLEKNGGTLINKINSISKFNKAYGEMLQKGYDLLKPLGIE